MERTPRSRHGLLSLLALVAGLALLGGCAALAPTPAAPTSPGVAAPTPTPTSPPTPTSEPTPSAATPPPPPAAAIGLRPVVEGLTAPVFVTGAGDGSGRLFVVEQGGRIRVVRDGRLLSEPYLDLSDRVKAGGEQGLLGLAFAPTFASDGRLYVDYTDRSGATVVSELTAPDPAADRADPATERVLLRIAQPFANHNGGALATRPDGTLWIATGDGGSAGDPEGNGQRLTTLLGKLLRIDPRPAAGAAYGIPSDNPFAGRTDARGEIWAYGLRNPWRFSFDRATGDLWIGDVGQSAWEEVDRWTTGSPAGPDFGWSVMEGTHCYKPAEGCARDGLVLPVAEYGHDEGCAVTGGYVARASGILGLDGTYLYGDYCGGTIWGLDAVAAAPVPRVLLASGLSISSFGEDDAGGLYVVDLGGGRVLRVVEAGS